ncbi:hypothetical protein GobsT_33120 [Gemmata obscuriglobus]|uniref:DUF4272 domain-containing protein n=1 Tax=Gemmata obscuriglobus TaxID=114 RepID=A0A2Z3H469_9BACT|nr:DUF4272 domain-containing protein [Gemmata obscuriglobus]AWM38517.1 DUF4272 domain-containing protein [Gemmata obscuriglobus]QEG28530.1 hypothetical protein GobsT_33120 [Gemmata obscuriglobus]VTS06606.1 Uncharacterized protein OS=Isosphaera pallida (strain ATCC 43644 / DSM 9630 / IS1B) GN=Isop_0612 PE=4 SV=1: DUF4272 [Gemmata obscuriglobus UQM 2246]
MAQEPINIFARIADPAGVAAFLREHAPRVELDGPDGTWENAVVTFGRGRSEQVLTFRHSAEYYSEPGWSDQMAGMRGYFARFPDTPRKEKVLLLTTTFRFSLGTLFEPDFDPDGDPRLSLLFALTQALDGVLFTPSGLRDASGRVLFSARGEEGEDPGAEWPKVHGSVSLDSPLGAAMHDASRPRAADEGPPEGAAPPAPGRVARRALALTAVTARAILEQDDPQSETVQRTYADLLAWVGEIGIDPEFEPPEREVLHRPLGQLTGRQQADATWRLEGLVVLAWALKRYEIPPHDEVVPLNPLWCSLGLLNAGDAQDLLARPELRSREEISALRNRQFAVHWRLRDQYLAPKPMDFAAFARTCRFGPLDITGLPLVEGDLAIGGERIDRAPPERFRAALSTALERHVAANWLWEGPETYSEASSAT